MGIMRSTYVDLLPTVWVLDMRNFIFFEVRKDQGKYIKRIDQYIRHIGTWKGINRSRDTDGSTNLFYRGVKRCCLWKMDKKWRFKKVSCSTGGGDVTGDRCEPIPILSLKKKLRQCIQLMDQENVLQKKI